MSVGDDKTQNLGTHNTAHVKWYSNGHEEADIRVVSGRGRGRKRGDACGGVEVWRCGGVEVWRCGGVEVWRCGGVAVWRCGGVEVWRCGGVAVWRCGGVEV